jgi:hypothetical protein
MAEKGENRSGSRRKPSKRIQDGGDGGNHEGGNPRGKPSLKDSISRIEIPCSQASLGMMEDELRGSQEVLLASIPCKQCQVNFVNESDRMIECDRCKLWECLACSGMDESLYQSLNDDNIGPYIHWYCRKCKESAMKAISTDNEIEVRCEQFFSKFREEILGEINTVKKDISELKNNQVQQSKNIAELRSEIEERNQKQVEGFRSEIEEKSQKQMEQAIKEVQDRQERKLNVIFFNVDESEAEDTNQAKQDDLAALRGILDSIEAKVPLANPIRLGKKEDSTTARPLRVRAVNEQDVTKIMKAAKKLKDHDSLSSVYINRDKTPLERLEWKKLVEERKEKNEEAKSAGREENWVIRNHKVVLGRMRDT